MPRNTGPRIPVTVNIGINDGTATTIVKYAFLSGLKSTLKDNFGQVVIDSSIAVNQLVFKANNVKPPKASKFSGTANGYEGSFCSAGKVAELKNNNYKITRMKYSQPALRGAAGSSLYYAIVNGLKIGYRVNDVSLPTNFAAATGLTLATADDIIIMGASFPTLGGARYTDPTTGKVSKYLCDPGNWDNLPSQSGWSQGKPPLISKRQLLTLLGI